MTVCVCLWMYVVVCMLCVWVCTSMTVCPWVYVVVCMLCVWGVSVYAHVYVQALVLRFEV